MDKSTVELLDQLERDYLTTLAAHLRRLDRDTEAVLESLDKTSIKGAINWGDLHCAQVAVVLSEQWRGLRIVIEEAAPGETQLIDAVLEGLYRLGWYGVEIDIETAW